VLELVDFGDLAIRLGPRVALIHVDVRRLAGIDAAREANVAALPVPWWLADQVRGVVGANQRVVVPAAVVAQPVHHAAPTVRSLLSALTADQSYRMGGRSRASSALFS